MTPLQRLSLLAFVALAALVAAPLASAHVTVTSTPPTEPLPVAQTTAVPVTISANCGAVLAEYEAMGVTELELGLVPDAEGVEPPGTINATGDAVPFTTDMCDPLGPLTVSATGNVYITPGPLAPAFQDIHVQPGAIGETNEGGAFTFQVAYAWAVRLVSANLTEGVNGTVVLEVTANADTILQLTADGLTVPAEVEVASPLLAGNVSRLVEVAVTPTGNGTLTLTVAAQAKGKEATGAPFALELTAAPAVAAVGGGHDEHEHDEDEEGKGAPGPALPLLAVALLAIALRRRRA